jgi:hypothetical protein
MTQPIMFTGDDDEPITLPAINELCWRCNGDGAHDSWDGGMTVDELYEQGDEFVHDYFAGRYDKPCEVCGGDKVLRVPDEERCNPQHLALYRAQEQAIADMRAEQAAEIAAGC